MHIQRNNIAQQVLSEEQKKLSGLLEAFSSTHILVGGTAIALQLGHRKSIDFDLFRFGQQGSGKQLAERIQAAGYTLDPKLSNLLWLSDEEQSDVVVFIDGVKVQLIDFSRNPFNVPLDIKSNIDLCGIPSLNLLYLGALKAYAMMYRNKWKDAVDMYFILASGISFSDIITTTQNIFGTLYKPEYTYETITSGTWDMTETVEYVIPNPPSEKEIIDFLQEQTKNILTKML